MSETPVNHEPISVIPQGSAPDGPEWQAQIARIAGSTVFRRSPRLRELLQHIADRSIAGRHDDLTESSIARDLYGRGHEYVPTDDSIVRSSVRQLRLKLRDYFETEGTLDRWVVDIPKGSYVAVFTRRGISESTLTPEVPAVPQDHPREPAARPRWNVGLLSVAAVLLASVALNVWLLARPVLRAEGSVQLDGLAPALVSAASRPTHFVLDDYAFVLLQRLSAHTFSTDEYARRDYLSDERSKSREPVVLDLWKLLGSRYLNSLGASATAERMLRSVGGSDKLVIQHARNLSSRSFLEGNYILYGSSPNNPWTDLFESRLNFQSQRADGRFSYVNRLPMPGEQPSYSSGRVASANVGHDYSRIAYLPNLSGSGFVLLVTGSNMVTAEAAGAYAVSSRGGAELRKLFRVARLSELPWLELLLQSSAVDATPAEVKVVAWRRVDPAP